MDGTVHALNKAMWSCN